jgi:hypothetical protein
MPLPTKRIGVGRNRPTPIQWALAGRGQPSASREWTGIPNPTHAGENYAATSMPRAAIGLSVRKGDSCLADQLLLDVLRGT